MQAVVTKIQFNTSKTFPNGKSFKGTLLTVQPPPYKGTPKPEKEYFIFPNAPTHNQAAQVKVGDTVDLSFDNTQYKNLESIRVVAAPTPPAQPGTVTPAYTPKQDSGTKDIAIARAVALKAGVELYSAMIQAGLTKKTITPETAVEIVFSMTKRFERYATLSEDLEELVADDSSIQSTTDSYEEVPFS